MPTGKKHTPTEKTRAQAEALASFGVPFERIAGFLGISKNLMNKYYAPHLQAAIDKRNAEVAGFLFHGASGKAIDDGASYSDCYKAAMFWAKTRMGWREKQDVNHTSEDGSMSPTRIEIVAPYGDSTD